MMDIIQEYGRVTKKKRSGGGLTGGDSDDGQGYFDPAGDYSRWSGHPTLRTLNILAWDPMNYFYDEGLSVDEYATAEHTGSTGKYRRSVIDGDNASGMIKKMIIQPQGPEDTQTDLSQPGDFRIMK